MKRPKELIIYLPIEQVKSEWVDFNNKLTVDYVIRIPYWLGRAYSRGNSKLLKCIFQDKVPCGNDRSKEEGDIEKKYFKENWSKKSNKMRKLNTNYIKFLPKEDVSLKEAARYVTDERFESITKKYFILKSRVVDAIEAQTSNDKYGKHMIIAEDLKKKLGL